MNMLKLGGLLMVGIAAPSLPTTIAWSADLMLPTKNQAANLTISDKELLQRYQSANSKCLGAASDIDMFVGCAERDILAATLGHRGYCRGSECQDESKAGWYLCAPKFIVK